jgi:hypothetical protein
VLAGAIALLFAATLAMAAGAEGVAVVVKLKGSVTCQEAGSDAWAAASQGTVLKAGTRVKTGDDGLAMVKFLADGSMMRLKPQTSLTINGRNDKSGAARLILGAATFEIPKRGGADRFAVSTPTSVATVKGTRFWVLVKADSASVVTCLDGVVEVAPPTGGKGKDVKAGFTAEATAAGVTVRPTKPGDIPADEVDQNLLFQFKDKDNNVKQLRIDFNETK